MASGKDNYTFEEFKGMFQNPTTEADPGIWMKSIRDKLYSMFRSPLKEEYFHEAFKWVSHLCLTVGDFSWISSDVDWTENEANMFSCIARLSVNEIHILLPLIQRDLTCGNEPDVEDGKVLARSAVEVEYDRFGCHLIIVESVIKTLVKGQELDDSKEGGNLLTNHVRGEELKNLLERLKEVIALICDYLELAHRHWHNLSKQQESNKFSSAEGALRIMSVWLSEDTGSFEAQCKRFLMDLIIKNLLLTTCKATQDDLLVLALHSICTNNDELLVELQRHDYYKEALTKYMFHVRKRRKNMETRSQLQDQEEFDLRCNLVEDLLSRTSEI